MNKLLIPIKPEWVSEILSGKKTLEIRKTVPKCKLPCEVYIYCGKDYLTDTVHYIPLEERNNPSGISTIKFAQVGKVVAKFTLKEVTQFPCFSIWEAIGKGPTKEQREVSDKSCLSLLDISKYANGKPLYLWRIDDLVIFDKAMELSELGLERAPKSWCYLKGETEMTDKERINLLINKNADLLQENDELRKRLAKAETPRYTRRELTYADEPHMRKLKLLEDWEQERGTDLLKLLGIEEGERK